MRALVKNSSGFSLQDLPRPSLNSPHDVRISVALAGLCRTDVAVALGLIQAPSPLILGHEFCGTVQAIGTKVNHLELGTRVAVNPIIPCGNCRCCYQHTPHWCLHSRFLGLNRHGAFADEVVVPQQNVFPLPNHVDNRQGAYLEPLAAAMAVLKAPIHPEEQGLVYGDNRIAHLTCDVLKLHGFSHITHHTNLEQIPQEQAFQFAIETHATTEVMEQLIGALAPGGKLILKSRTPHGFQLSPLLLLEKEISIHAVHYGSFPDALDLLASGKLNLDPLLGDTYSLLEAPFVFENASNEQVKVFFDPKRG